MQAANTQSLPQANRPLLRFVVFLAGGFLMFLGIFYFWISESEFFARYLSLNASASAAVMRWLGTDVVADGIQVRSSEYSLMIKHGCDALQPTAFFVIAMLSSPVAVPWKRRMPPILAGIAALLLLNIVRIVTLFYAGWKTSPTVFELLHEDIWQAVFIFLPLVFWIGWALRVTRKPTGTMHDPA